MATVEWPSMSLTRSTGKAKRERFDLVGAITITEYELVENVAWLNLKLEHPGGANPAPLSNVAYPSVQLLLARKLPPVCGNHLAKAYAMIPVAQGTIQPGIDHGGLGTEEVKELRGIGEGMETARAEIASHRETLTDKQ